MKKSRLLQIMKEEIHNGKLGILNEELEHGDESEIREMIRTEVAAIFFELFKKRKSWGA